MYPDFTANFSFSGLPCPNLPIQFTDLSTATYKPIDSWHWDFGDSLTSIVENPSHTYTVGGTYEVTLAAHTVKGCIDTARKPLTIEKFVPFAGNDTIIVKGEHIDFHATGGSFYTLDA